MTGSAPPSRCSTTTPTAAWTSTVGAPGENDGTGAVTTLRGSGTSFTTKGSKTFGLATLGYPERDGASFGSALGS